MANIYKPETWGNLSDSVKAKLLVIKSWIDKENEVDEIDWNEDF